MLLLLMRHDDDLFDVAHVVWVSDGVEVDDDDYLELDVVWVVYFLDVVANDDVDYDVLDVV